MRILMFSWEFPPKSVGGLAVHVAELSEALVRAGHEVQIVTTGGEALTGSEIVNGVKVHRVQPYSLPTPDFRTWILHLNIAMLQAIMELKTKGERFDIIHNHDWLTAYAARAVKHGLNCPLVATIHATEYGRNYGLHNDEQRYISDVEWWLGYEAWRVIVCSNYMEDEVKRVFQLPQDKIRVIPNGVDPKKFEALAIEKDFKARYAHDSEKIVFYVGRLVHEKGVNVLLDAVPKVLHYHPRTKFVIAGKGPSLDYLKYKAGAMGISQTVYFTGYIDDETRNKLYSVANVAVFPSLYEPFGIVALEGMAAKTPVVVSDTGGLGEIVKHEVNGCKAYAGSANSLADNILHVLGDTRFAERIKQNAWRDVNDIYNWDKIAHRTANTYQEVLAQVQTWQ